MIILTTKENEELIGKRASVTYQPLREGQEETIEGVICEVEWVKWDPEKSRVPCFETYQRITINFAKQGEREEYTL